MSFLRDRPSTILASIKNKKNSKALTIDLDDDNFISNEKLLAKKTALINQIPHLTAKIDRKEMNKLINLFYEKMDSPTNDGLNNFLISHSAKKIILKLWFQVLEAMNFLVTQVLLEFH